MWKRILSLLLCLVLAASFFPAAAFAEDAEEAEPTEESGEEFIFEEAAEEPEAADALAVERRVIFLCEPAELTLAVYDRGEREADPESAPIIPEEDGTYLLLPGEYLYTASCEGYVPITDEPLLVEAGEEALCVELCLPALTEEAQPGEEHEETAREDAEPEAEADALLPEGDAELQAASGSCGSNLSWTLDDSGTLTISGTGAMADYWFSSSNRAPWMSRASSIKTVVIRSGVTSIGEWAFDGCSNMTSVTIPSSVTRIGEYAFQACEGLTSVTIPESVTRIERSTFYCCEGLTSVTIPNSVTSISDEAFSTCLGLTSVTIPKSVTTIGSGAFFGCSWLKEIRFLGAPSSISTNAFANVTATVYFPSNTGWTEAKRQNYGGRLTWKEMFSGTCGPNLNWLLIDDAMTITGTGPMTDYQYGYTPWNDQLRSIKTVEIQPGATSIGSHAFCWAESLTRVTIPESVVSIGEWAFYRCENLTSAPLPEGLASIGECAFYGCANLSRLKLPSTLLSFGKSCFSLCNSLSTIELPDGVTTIPEEMFQGCNVRSIRIPASVTRVEESAFHYCTLDVVFFGGTREQWDAISIDYYNTPLEIARIICEGDAAQSAGSEVLTMSVPGRAWYTPIPAKPSSPSCRYITGKSCSPRARIIPLLTRTTPRPTLWPRATRALRQKPPRPSRSRARGTSAAALPRPL